VKKRTRRQKISSTKPAASSLVQEFVEAVFEAVDALMSERIDSPSAALIPAMIELVNDQKFRDPWADPEFKSNCLSALEARIKTQPKRKLKGRKR
jgi:hypothetical protein